MLILKNALAANEYWNSLRNGTAVQQDYGNIRVKIFEGWNRSDWQGSIAQHEKEEPRPTQ